MKRFSEKSAYNLDLPELKANVNRRLPAGYSVAVSADSRGLVMEVYDGDVLIMSVPISGLSQKDAEDKVLTEFGETNGN